MKTLSSFLGAVLFLFSQSRLRADALDNWKSVAMITNASAIAYGNGQFVAVRYVFSSTNVVQISKDGNNWECPTIFTNQSHPMYLADITFANGLFVACGSGGIDGGVFVGTNGFSLSRVASSKSLHRVVYGNGLFVAVGLDVSWVEGSSNILTSLDGYNWTPRSCGAPVNTAPEIRDVACGYNSSDGAIFVARDTEGNFYRSVDSVSSNPPLPPQPISGTAGSNWTMSFKGYPGSEVSYCNGRFIASAGPGTNRVSISGSTWLLSTNNTASIFKRVIYDHGYYLALSISNLFTSMDLTNWTKRDISSSAGTMFSSIAFGDRKVVVLSASPSPNTIYMSDPFASLGLTSRGTIQLSLSGLQGRSYRIDYINGLQSSTNIWQTLVTLVLTNSPLLWTDTNATNSHRVYRSVLLP